MENIHDYSYLLRNTIEWLEAHLALSEKRFGNSDPDNAKQHAELREQINNLKGFQVVCDHEDEDGSAEKGVKEAFEWLGTNIWKCWC